MIQRGAFPRDGAIAILEKYGTDLRQSNLNRERFYPYYGTRFRLWLCQHGYATRVGTRGKINLTASTTAIITALRKAPAMIHVGGHTCTNTYLSRSTRYTVLHDPHKYFLPGTDLTGAYIAELARIGAADGLEFQARFRQGPCYRLYQGRIYKKDSARPVKFNY